MKRLMIKIFSALEGGNLESKTIYMGLIFILLFFVGMLIWHPVSWAAAVLETFKNFNFENDYSLFKLVSYYHINVKLNNYFIIIKWIRFIITINKISVFKDTLYYTLVCGKLHLSHK